MFGINLRRLVFICDKIPVRQVRSRGRRSSNPGLDNTLRALKEDGIKLQDDNVEEFIEQTESNVYDFGGAYNEHLNETLIGKHELRHHIVKEKYFKENMPNLLTWSEKEQIRHLASTQPQEWTPQHIAESFPVTEEVAKKLLKYPWKPATEERIARHDASAMRNWKELKEGSLDIPENLREHFLKFSERTIPPLNRKSIKLDLSQEKMGEFEKIIRQCAFHEKNNDVHREETHSETKVKTRKRDLTRTTLDELANKIKNRLDHGKNVEIPDKMIIDTVSAVSNKSKSDVIEISNEIELSHRKDEDSLTKYEEQQKEIVTKYPERIRIPKKAYRKGATYKVNDCFYDDDGRFLYRVMGMDENH